MMGKCRERRQLRPPVIRGLRRKREGGSRKRCFPGFLFGGKETLLGIPLCLLAAFGLHWGIVGVYALLTTEEIFRLAVSLVIFKKRSWMISL